MKIFINIAAYQEPNLLFTLESLYYNAKNKDSLVFSVVDQSSEQFKLNVDTIPFKEQIRYVHLDPTFARGPCFARSLGQMAYQDEEYYFQSDSHCVFDSDWDQTYITQYEAAKKHVSKPVLTQYPFGFEFLDDSRDIKKIKKFRPKQTPVIALHDRERTFEPNSYYINPLAKEREGSLIPGFLASAGQIFTSGEIVYEVPYDPFLFFGGEEQTLALRLFTNGYDIVHFNKSPMYHLYYSGPEDRTLVWNDQIHEEKRTVPSSVRDTNAVKRLNKIVTGQDLGVYGVGSVRSLVEYREFCGIDYLNRTWNEKSTFDEGIWKPFEQTE